VPLAQAFALDEGGEGFVEGRVTRQVVLLVRQLVEDHRDEALVVPAQHGVQQWVVKPAQGGIGLGIDDPLAILDRLGPTTARRPEGRVADDKILGIEPDLDRVRCILAVEIDSDPRRVLSPIMVGEGREMTRGRQSHRDHFEIRQGSLRP